MIPVALLFLAAILAGARPVTAQTEIRNSIQTGFEYDSNVFKTFEGGEGGALNRTLLKSRGTHSFSRPFRLGWDYQGGGKVFFEQASKDALIQFVEIPFSWQATPTLEFLLRPDLKYLEEKGGSEAGGLSEDHLSTTSRLDVRISLPSSFLLIPHGEFTFFHFFDDASYSFFREAGGITAQKSIGSLLAFGVDYLYGRQQFGAGDREDREQQVSAFVKYLRVPYLSARYTYEWSSSSLPQYSFHNHRIVVIASLPLFPRPGNVSSGDAAEDPPALFVFHLLGTLQLKDYPSVYAYTEEGQRYLLTGAEDDNFNSVVAKLSFHPFARWAFEGKYTRYGNEYSEAGGSFSRSLFYGGARFSF